MCPLLTIFVRQGLVPLEAGDQCNVPMDFGHYVSKIGTSDGLMVEPFVESDGVDPEPVVFLAGVVSAFLVL
eukprot:CAMPEP_0113478982 /NCGR_PEP_ID=MMETSP0014_2-20120614/21056_1 /TAXON_ID=2857 /ORGANISM="Nitzschia sp." /LENGTH=70 /DNA_ID=CAMNT_0000372229 /DNA_START=233 /DNA_END=445 /DNA_ORIENTATION=+ /assembly_acc=CAM_ASM_000159